MSLTLSAVSVVVLFSAMLMLAALPGVGVMTVVARTASYGFSHAVATTLGMAAVDTLLIVLVLSGLSLLYSDSALLFVVVKWVAAIYLLWLAFSLFTNVGQHARIRLRNEASLGSSFLAGLLITAGDQKLMLFYVSFFPAYVDMGTITAADILIIVGIDLLALFLSKLGYALVADKSRHWLSEHGAGMALRAVTALVLALTALWMIFT